MMKRWVFLAVVLLCSGGVFVDAAALRDDSGGNGELVLLHTNDRHGTVLPHNGWGGLAENASYIKAVRAFNPHVLLLDAGDFNTGSALSNMFAAEPDIRAYNLMGYDAVVFGNHEFDGSAQKLDAQIALAEFPFVCSNIQTAAGTFLGGNQYIVKKYKGFSVGILGITTLRTLSIANPDKSLVFINEIDAARAAVDILRNQEQVDIVIGLTHIGNIKETPDHITSVELAAAVEGIDIIIDGHSHTFMEAPIKAGSTWIVSAGEWGKYIGQGTAIIRGGKLADFKWAPAAIGPDPAVAAMLEPYIAKAGESLKEVIGAAADTFVFGSRLPRYQETAIGNLISDACTWYMRAVYNQDIDFAFHNGGNIRAGLPSGPLTREQILTVLPFENYLYVVSLTGADIIALFDFFAAIPQGSGGFPQCSQDVRYTIDKQSGSGVITDLSIGGAPVDPERIYRFCTNDYLLGGGDGYTILTGAVEPFNTSLLLSSVVIEYINAHNGAVSPVIDGRLTILGGTIPPP